MLLTFVTMKQFQLTCSISKLSLWRELLKGKKYVQTIEAKTFRWFTDWNGFNPLESFQTVDLSPQRGEAT